MPRRPTHVPEHVRPRLHREGRWWRSGGPIVVVVGAVLAGTAVTLWLVSGGSNPSSTHRPAAIGRDTRAAHPARHLSTAAGRSSSGPSSTASAATVPPTSGPTTTVPPSVPTPCVAAGVPGGAYAVGDSVMVDAEQDLEACVPGIQVNAAVSRQWSDGEAVLRQVMAGPQHPAVVVVGLGTNGPITAADFDTMMSILQGASRVVFVTVHVDRPWQDQVNGVLVAGAARYRTAVLADWAGVAAQNPQWFYADGTHLPIGGPGAQALADLIANRL